MKIKEISKKDSVLIITALVMVVFMTSVAVSVNALTDTTRPIIIEVTPNHSSIRKVEIEIQGMDINNMKLLPDKKGDVIEDTARIKITRHYRFSDGDAENNENRAKCPIPTLKCGVFPGISVLPDFQLGKSKIVESVSSHLSMKYYPRLADKVDTHSASPGEIKAREIN